MNNTEPPPKSFHDGILVTDGDWQDEESSAAAFDSLLNECALFRVYKEVRGFYVQPRYGQDFNSPRIDRILVPNQSLVERGWNQGIIGVELKRSGIKAGPILAQMIDYNRSIWRLPNGGFDVWLRWVFLWPLRKTHNTPASFMAQNCLGSCCTSPWETLGFHSGESLILSVRNGQGPTIGKPKNGIRAGSR